MANFVHYEFDAGPEYQVEVTLNLAANVQLLDPINFEQYRSGRQYRYYGGHVTQSPFRIQPPFQGHWHLVIDLGGGVGQLTTSVRLVPVWSTI